MDKFLFCLFAYFTCVFIYSTLHVNYSLYIIIINRNILSNAIVTRMNKYIIIIS